MKFQSPHDGSMMILTPEHSMEIQNAIGAGMNYTTILSIIYCGLKKKKTKKKNKIK